MKKTRAREEKKHDIKILRYKDLTNILPNPYILIIYDNNLISYITNKVKVQYLYTIYHMLLCFTKPRPDPDGTLYIGYRISDIGYRISDILLYGPSRFNRAGTKLNSLLPPHGQFHLKSRVGEQGRQFDRSLLLDRNTLRFPEKLQWYRAPLAFISLCCSGKRGGGLK